jgi:AcrR family transcriptional regulator
MAAPPYGAGMVNAEAERRGRPARSDARRNYDQLMAAAQATFAEQGTDASLREVARRAGVGIGTLYRNFATREALLEALLGRGFDTLQAHAAELLTASDPDVALGTWLQELAIGSTRYDGLPASVMSALQDPQSSLHASCAGLQAAAADLLARAQSAGGIRPDLTTDELLATVSAMAWAARQAPEPAGTVERYLRLLLDGLAVRARST